MILNGYYNNQELLDTVVVVGVEDPVIEVIDVIRGDIAEVEEFGITIDIID